MTQLRSRGAARAFAGEVLVEVPVRIGDVKVARGDSLLFTIGLGSCVAVALWDPELCIGGLAHAILPTPGSGRAEAPRGRFVETAVPELLRMMVDAGATAQQLRARIAGGASMFRDVLESEGLKLGRRNVEAAQEALAKEGLQVEGEDVYGTYGRSVFLRTRDGRMLVTSVNHDDVLL